MSYPNSGKLSPNKYKNDDPRKPDFVGELVMQRSTLRELLQEHADDEIVLKLGGWNRSGQYGSFISLSWNNYKKKEEVPAPTPAPPPAAPVDDSDIPF